MDDLRVNRRLKNRIAARAGGCCEYCRSRMDHTTESFSIEHITPRSRGGRTILRNLALSCQGCNSYKHNKVTGRAPVTEQLAPLFHPRRQKWRDHFAWSDDCTRIHGLTPTGRATVVTLKMNRTELVNLRQALIAISKHPPSD